MWKNTQPGKSFIDVAQSAFQSLVEDRDLDAQWWKIFKGNVSGDGTTKRKWGKDG